ncbi:gas vesicle protein [Mycobacterium sp. B14F4]|uniref:gas vesicle protein GvpO n=1 Tax=Mycobacterium sp. B14F4 TaxID=3153565 RepID=UPI00325E12EB
MAQRTRTQSHEDGHTEEAPLNARDAAATARECIAELIGRDPAAMTSVELTDQDGWVVEFEVVEDRRIPSSSDVLALYEVELDADGELLGFRRTSRYLRGQTRNGGGAT